MVVFPSRVKLVKLSFHRRTSLSPKSRSASNFRNANELTSCTKKAQLHDCKCHHQPSSHHLKEQFLNKLGLQNRAVYFSCFLKQQCCCEQVFNITFSFSQSSTSNPNTRKSRTRRKTPWAFNCTEWFALFSLSPFYVQALTASSCVFTGCFFFFYCKSQFLQAVTKPIILHFTFLNFDVCGFQVYGRVR